MILGKKKQIMRNEYCEALGGELLESPRREMISINFGKMDSNIKKNVCSC